MAWMHERSSRFGRLSRVTTFIDSGKPSVCRWLPSWNPGRIEDPHFTFRTDANTRRHTMKTILETDRLLLREFAMDDVKEFFRMVSDPDVTRFTGDDCQTLEAARKRLEDGPFQDYRKHGYGRWAAVYKTTGTVIGFAGLKYLDDIGEVDLGFRFFKEHWGKGLATEASRAIVAYGL